MKPSRYNVMFPAQDDGLVVFNTLTGAMAEFEAVETAGVRRMLDDADLSGLPAETLTELTRLGMVVPHSADELAVVRSRKAAGVADSNRLDVVVMPTLDCNFRCVYCYERHVRSSMSADVRDALITFLERETPTRKGVMLHWYGGEPLLELETVLTVTRAARRAAQEAGVPLSLHMTTNGYLLTEETAGRLVGAGLREYQITIDGGRDSHDRLRPLRGGAATFDTVFANTLAVLRVADDVQVSVRVNFNAGSADAVPDLLDAFPADVRPRVRFVFEPIFGREAVRARAGLEDAEIGGLLESWHRRAAELGFASSVGGVHAGKLVYCYAEREHQVLVSYDGSVFKCPVGDFTAERPLGALRRDGVVEWNEGWADWMGVPPFDAVCEDCVYAPLCMGGCRKERLRTGGRGDACALVPQNVSYVLKQLALRCDNGLGPLLGLTVERGGGAAP